MKFILLGDKYYNISYIASFDKELFSMENFSLVKDCPTHGQTRQVGYSFSIWFINGNEMLIKNKSVYNEGYPEYEKHTKEIKDLHNKLLNIINYKQ